jgi:hypothetical protein
MSCSTGSAASKNIKVKEVEANFENFLVKNKLISSDELSNQEAWIAFLKKKAVAIVAQDEDPFAYVLAHHDAMKLEFASTETQVTTCPDDEEFLLANFIDLGDNPILSPMKEANLRKIHSTIIKPIAAYYKAEREKEGLLVDGICMVSVNNGLSSTEYTRTKILGSSIVSGHVSGTAIDFTVIGKRASEVIEDIKTKKINVDFGVIAEVNGIHITLPHKFNGEIVSRLLLKSVNGSIDNVVHEFI